MSWKVRIAFRFNSSASSSFPSNFMVKLRLLKLSATVLECPPIISVFISTLSLRLAADVSKSPSNLATVPRSCRISASLSRFDFFNSSSSPSSSSVSSEKSDSFVSILPLPAPCSMSVFILCLSSSSMSSLSSSTSSLSVSFASPVSPSTCCNFPFSRKSLTRFCFGGGGGAVLAVLERLGSTSTVDISCSSPSPLPSASTACVLFSSFVFCSSSPSSSCFFSSSLFFPL
mmetsp:Transcript_15899/g.32659  ORF Transcript_15899/g.32659 Transcript_15899/m.32659 type:complete len:230 (-) Transcript_15899:74-763(-)